MEFDQKSMELTSLKRSLSTKLFRAVFSLYLIVAVVLTGVHLVIEYYAGKSRVQQSLEQYQRTFADVIARSAWNMDRKQLGDNLEAIFSLPNVYGVAFIPNHSSDQDLATEYFHGDRPKTSTISMPHITQWQDGLISVVSPITYEPVQGERLEIGYMVMYSHVSAVFSTVKDSFIVILVNSLVKTAALFVFFTLAFNRVLRKPLLQFTKRIEAIDLNQEVMQQGIAKETDPGLELDVLIGAYNRMLEKIDQFSKENRELSENLAELNRNLEQKVKQKSRQLESAQRKLIRAAHASGMSQVAAETLHNIGNMMTGLMLTVQNMRDNFTSNAIQNYQQVVNILESKVAEWQRDEALPVVKFLQTFGQKLSADMGAVNRTIEIMQKFITQLGRLSEQQRRYIHTERADMEVNVDSLIEDSLRLAGIYSETDKITLQIESHIPKGFNIVSDEAKLLQIFTNILTNAKQSLYADPRTDKKLHVIISLVGTFLEFKIIDNGIGIEEQQMPQIFRAGFTTKERGSGLGLHNSANYIQILGGRISVASAGVHQGACFTVMVPTQRQAQVA